MHSLVPVAHADLGYRLYALLKFGLAAPAGFVVAGGCVDRQNPVSPADRHVPLTANLVHQLVLVDKRQIFRRSTSCSMALARETSATSFFSFVFSSSNCFRRPISPGSDPSCFFFHLKYVASKTPALPQILATA
jgi:hypothetical protein